MTTIEHKADNGGAAIAHRVSNPFKGMKCARLPSAQVGTAIMQTFHGVIVKMKEHVGGISTG